MKDDLTGVYAGRRDAQRRLVVLASEIIPDALAGLRTAKPDHISAKIPRPTEALYRLVALQAFLPFSDKNLPFG